VSFSQQLGTIGGDSITLGSIGPHTSLMQTVASPTSLSTTASLSLNSASMGIAASTTVGAIPVVVGAGLSIAFPGSGGQEKPKDYIEYNVSLGASYTFDFLDEDIPIARKKVELGKHILDERNFQLRQILVGTLNELLGSTKAIELAEKRVKRAEYFAQIVSSRSKSGNLYFKGDEEGIRGAMDFVTVSKKDLEISNILFESTKFKLLNLLKTIEKTGAKIPIFAETGQSEEERKARDAEEKAVYGAYFRELERV
ncbi:unnamed protein product, partial [marine sediment metagenome]